MNNLRKLRNIKKLSVRDLAARVNINSSTLSRIENEETSFNTDYIKILTKFFNVSSDYLLGLSDIPNPKPHQLKYFAKSHQLLTLEDIVLKHKHEYITIRFFNDYIKIIFDDLNKSEVIYTRVNKGR